MRMKTRTLNEVMKDLSSARRKRIEMLATKAIAEEMTLKALRKAKKPSST